FGEVAAVAEVESDTHAGSLGQFRLAPARLLGDGLEDGTHTRGVESWRRLPAPPTAAATRWLRLRRWRGQLIREHVEAELHRIFVRRRRQLIDEGLHNKSDGVAARRAKRARWNAERHARRVEGEVRNVAPGEITGTHRRARRVVERDEV